jgi:BASS family bile acid:Na+ symporter
VHVLNKLTNLFPVWVVLGGVASLIEPRLFTWFNTQMIVWGLAVIMLGMGVTLTLNDFKAVLKSPRAIAVGFFGQFLIMPSVGFVVAKIMDLPTPMAVGLILVSCCPGGTASNLVTFLAGGKIALSVLMTMCTTFAAIILTPLLTELLAGTMVPVDGKGLFFSTVQVVLIPLVVGLALNRYFPRQVGKVLPVAPLVSVMFIVLICSSIIGGNAASIRGSGLRLLGSVFLVHSCGFLLGYWFCKLFGYDPIVCRTVSIEVGMQNSGLGVVLARKHFADPLTAVPCAISSVFHSVIGSVLAGVWRLRPVEVKALATNSVEEARPTQQASR